MTLLKGTPEVSSQGYEGILLSYINTDFPHGLNKTKQLLK